MNLLISVIVPVYNVEHYLYRCVNSIINQSYKDLEIILVDDGSSDNSGLICDEYASKDSRVSVIHKINGGASDARNIGLQKAKGDYVMFVDSDDFWKDNICLEKLIAHLIRLNYPDLLGFNIYYYYPSTKKYVPWVSYDSNITSQLDKDSLISALVKTGTFPMATWSKLLKKKSLEKAGIHFIKGTTAEDIPWFIELLDKLHTIRFVNDYVYCYRQEVTTSVTGSFNSKKYDDIFAILTNLIPMIKNATFSKQAKKALLSFCAYEFCILMGSIRTLSKPERRERMKQLKQMNWLMKYDMNPKVQKVNYIFKPFGFWAASYACYRYLCCRC